MTVEQRSELYIDWRARAEKAEALCEMRTESNIDLIARLAESEQKCAELAEENRNMLQDLRWVWMRVMGGEPGPPPMSQAVQMIADKCAELAAALKEYVDKIAIAAEADEDLILWDNPSKQALDRVRALYKEADAVMDATNHEAILLAHRATVERETREQTWKRCVEICGGHSWVGRMITSEFAPKGETDAKRD